MDITQLLLSATLTVTTIFLIVIGIQLIFVFRELRKTLLKVNNIIEGFEKVGINITHGFTEFVGFFGGLKTFFKIIESINKKRHAKQK